MVYQLIVLLCLAAGFYLSAAENIQDNLMSRIRRQIVDGNENVVVDIENLLAENRDDLMDVFCLPDNMCVSVSRAFYELNEIFDVNFDDVTMDQPCGSANFVTETKNTICTGGFTTCGTKMSINSSFVEFSNMVRSFSKTKSGVLIGQSNEHVIPWKCTYPLNYLVKLTSSALLEDFYFSPSISQIRNLVIDTELTGVGYGHFSVGMFLYKQSSQDEVYTTPPVFDINERLYVGVTLIDGPEKAVIELVKCWATPTNNSNDSTNFQIISDYCPSDEIIVIEDKKTTSNYRWNSPIFKFEDSDKVYLHCYAKICFTDQQSCNKKEKCDLSSRKRRSVKSNLTADITMLSIGPLNLELANLVVRSNGSYKIVVNDVTLEKSGKNNTPSPRDEFAFYLMFGVLFIILFVTGVYILVTLYRRLKRRQ